jgi:hypothetical protein
MKNKKKEQNDGWKEKLLKLLLEYLDCEDMAMTRKKISDFYALGQTIAEKCTEEKIEREIINGERCELCGKAGASLHMHEACARKLKSEIS